MAKRMSQGQRQRAARRRTKEAQRTKPTISEGTRRPGEQVFRYAWANDPVARWKMAGLSLLAMAVLGIGLPAAGSEVLGLDGGIIIVLAVSGFMLPIVVAAVMGAMAIHRNGWLLGLGFGVGFWLLMLGGLRHWLMVAGFALMVASVAGFWVLGRIRGVPRWLGWFGPLRIMVDDGRLEGEKAPGLLDPGYRKPESEVIPFPDE